MLRYATITALFLAAVLAPRAGGEPKENAMQHIPVSDPRIQVCGLPWYAEDAPEMVRLPVRLKETFRRPLWAQALHGSGARLRFRTDSLSVDLKAAVRRQTMHHMAPTGSAGFDIYVDNFYVGTGLHDAQGRFLKTKREEPWTIGRERKMRDITVYLPLYSPARVDEIILDGAAKLEAPRPFARSKPVVFYGTSITQGGCAANPGASYPAIVCRRLNVDFVNLGFSGNGMGDVEVARAMTEIDCSCIVLDYWANPSPDQLERTPPVFVDTLREKFPDVPILIPQPYFEPKDEIDETWRTTNESKRRIIRAFVKVRREAGDAHIETIDGFELLSKEYAYGLVDGRHCNTLGFHLFATGLEPHLRDALGLEKE